MVRSAISQGWRGRQRARSLVLSRVGPMPNRLLLRLLSSLLLALPASAAWAQGGPPAVTVSAPLKKEIVEWQQFTGQFSAVEFVELRARVSGYLTEINFQDGQIVKKGDPL